MGKVTKDTMGRRGTACLCTLGSPYSMGPCLSSFSTACIGHWRVGQTVSGSSTGHSSSSLVMVWDPSQLVGMCSPHSTSCASSHHNLFCPLLLWPCPCHLEAQGYLHYLQSSFKASVRVVGCFWVASSHD